MTDNEQAQIEVELMEMIEDRDQDVYRHGIDLLEESPRAFAKRIVERVNELRKRPTLRADAERLREMGMPEGFSAAICIYGTPPMGPPGSAPAKVGALMIEVSRDGQLVASEIIDVKYADDGKWVKRAIELAKNVAAHEHRLHA